MGKKGEVVGLVPVTIQRNGQSQVFSRKKTLHLSSPRYVVCGWDGGRGVGEGWGHVSIEQQGTQNSCVH